MVDGSQEESPSPSASRQRNSEDTAGRRVETPVGGEMRTTVDTVVAAGQLLASPRKCALWHESWLADGLPIQDLAVATGIPQSTVYDLTREMVEEGSLFAAGTTENNATILKPTPMQVFVSEHPENIGPQYNIHSTLIGVVGRGTHYTDVETFIERNNYTALVQAITGVLVILSTPDLETTDLASYYEWMDPVDAQLIQGHIAAVLQRESTKSSIEWTFPDDPPIEPVEDPDI